MKHSKLYKMLLATSVSLGLAGCAKTQPQTPVEVIIKVPTLTMNCLSNPEIADANDFLELASTKYKEANPDANVDFQVEVFDYVDEGEAIVGSYNTPDATDILYEGYFNMAGYMNHNMLAPLDDIITDEIRNDIPETSWAQSQKDGVTYMMPYLSMQNILAYDKQLLQQAGLDDFISEDAVIQNWTLEEWDYILNTLAATLPEGSYPMFMYANSNQGDTHIMTLLRSRGGEIFTDDGKFDFTSEPVLEALNWINNGVQQGWYAPYSHNLEMNDCQQLFQDERLAFYVFNNANFVLYDNFKDTYGFVNFPGNLATSFITGFEVFDNGDEEKLHYAKDLIRFIYEDEELMNLSAGNLPESKAVAARYEDQIEMLKEFSGNASHVYDFMRGSNNWQGRDDSVRSVFWPEIHNMLAGLQTPEETAQNLTEKCNAALEVDTSL